DGERGSAAPLAARTPGAGAGNGVHRRPLPQHRRDESALAIERAGVRSWVHADELCPRVERSALPRAAGRHFDLRSRYRPVLSVAGLSDGAASGTDAVALPRSTLCGGIVAAAHGSGDPLLRLDRAAREPGPRQ